MSEVDYSKPLANQKWELYAQAKAAGKSGVEALEAAGYSPVPTNTTRLTKNNEIQKRIAYLQNRVAAKVTVTLEDLINMALEDRRDAREAEQYSASIKAIDLVAKLTGQAAPSKVQLTGADGGPIQTADVSATELAKAILELTPEQRAIARVLAEKKVKR